MDPVIVNSENAETTANDEPDQVEEVPAIVMKRRGRPTGSKNKGRESDTGTPAATAQVVPTPPPDTSMYDALMKRLDAMNGALERRQDELTMKKEPRPKKVTIAPSIPEEAPPTPQPLRRDQFHISGSPRTASRQLMAHLYGQQRERATERERMYENFLPL
jgi:hypothetical protein